MPGSALACLFNLEPAALCLAFVAPNLLSWWFSITSRHSLLPEPQPAPGHCNPRGFRQALPLGSLGLVFPRPPPSLVSYQGLSPGPGWLLSPRSATGHNLSLSFLITLFKNRFFMQTKLVLGGCSVSYASLLPCHRRPRLHGVKGTNFKCTKQVPQNEPQSEVRPCEVFFQIFPTDQKFSAVPSLWTPLLSQHTAPALCWPGHEAGMLSKEQNPTRLPKNHESHVQHHLPPQSSLSPRAVMSPSVVLQPPRTPKCAFLMAHALDFALSVLSDLAGPKPARGWTQHLPLASQPCHRNEAREGVPRAHWHSSHTGLSCSVHDS